MFELFKKTSWKIDGKAFDFFDKLFKQLPTEFHFLSDGLHKGLYRRFSINYAIKGHHYTISFDPSQSDKSMVKGKQFELQNILVIQSGANFPLNLTVYEGLWVGLEIEKNILDFADFHFDLSRLHKDKSKFAADSKIERLVSGLSSTNLDLHNLNEFEIDGKCYYQIKDLEDGNYIVIDNKGQVFGLIHDPYKIELINKSIKHFVDDVNNGLFDFEKYLTGRNG
ncbi:MAG TPA: hypothetical protein VFW07_05555 [Parafilimonas sp.]|nr:hypothetical protein [Parafilimonas sp.]